MTVSDECGLLIIIIHPPRTELLLCRHWVKFFCHKYFIFQAALSEGPILRVGRVRLRVVKQRAHVDPLCKEQS